MKKLATVSVTANGKTIVRMLFLPHRNGKAVLGTTELKSMLAALGCTRRDAFTVVFG